MWTRPERDLAAARRLLAPDGALCLSVQQPPWRMREATFLDDTADLLKGYGFVVTDRIGEVLQPWPVALIARFAPVSDSC